MKKTLLVVAIATCFAVSAHAQGAVGSISLKPMVGGSLTSIVGKDVTGVSMKIGLVAGAEMTYQVSPKFAACADGTAMQCGRVGGRLLSMTKPCYHSDSRASFLCPLLLKNLRIHQQL